MSQNDTPASYPIAPNPTWHTLAEFALRNQPDSEQLARSTMAEVVASLRLSTAHLERLKTAVARATGNALEHGRRNQTDLPIVIRVQVSEKALHGSSEPSTKFSGQQTSRGWGFFLIEKMMNDRRTSADEAHHTIELFLYLEGENDEPQVS